MSVVKLWKITGGRRQVREHLDRLADRRAGREKKENDRLAAAKKRRSTKQIRSGKYDAMKSIRESGGDLVVTWRVWIKGPRATKDSGSIRKAPFGITTEQMDWSASALAHRTRQPRRLRSSQRLPRSTEIIVPCIVATNIRVFHLARKRRPAPQSESFPLLSLLPEPETFLPLPGVAIHFELNAEHFGSGHQRKGRIPAG